MEKLVAVNIETGEVKGDIAFYRTPEQQEIVGKKKKGKNIY
ncbi:hypothetical protein ACIQZI_22835 [Peribacillus sp. NPDC096379]